MDRHRLFYFLLPLCVFALFLPALFAQDATAVSPEPSTSQSLFDQSMTGMDMNAPHAIFIDQVLAHTSSGTSMDPASSPESMLMAMRSNWMFMFHGVAFIEDQQQSGPRSADKLFSTNWMMGMAQHKLGPGQVTFRAMLSLEPATITGRLYPELFQVGESAFGRPIVDGQHPHNFFMELTAIYDLHIRKNWLVSFYAAPVGDPALGPVAFPHRTSASEDPLATLGHHMEDSTHVAEGVATVGLTYRKIRIEASGFHGREPDEFRWDIDPGRLDSWSSRLTIAPTKNWIAQYSLGHLHSPEQIYPNEDILRMTASISYNRSITNGDWSSSFIWGRNHTIGATLDTDAYLAESLLNFKTRNYVWGRFESVDRTNELLLGSNLPPIGFVVSSIGKVEATSIGYSRDIVRSHHIQTALGAQLTLYNAPPSLSSIYGSHPVGALFFLRIRPFTPHHP